RLDLRARIARRETKLFLVPESAVFLQVMYKQEHRRSSLRIGSFGALFHFSSEILKYFEHVCRLGQRDLPSIGSNDFFEIFTLGRTWRGRIQQDEARRSRRELGRQGDQAY